jgi:5-methylcytosine-specific restriction endonuclease McrA
MDSNLPLDAETKHKRKQKIPVAIREQIWIRTFGKEFQGKCPTSWCQNTITVFDFHSGHNIPESKGGQTNPGNLIPLCARCNTSMGDRYTFTEWTSMNKVKSNQGQGQGQGLSYMNLMICLWCCQ